MTADCGGGLTYESHAADPGKLLTPGEVAKIFRVDPKTVTRWAQSERLPSILTPGGHRRFWESDVLKLLRGEGIRRSRRVLPEAS